MATKRLGSLCRSVLPPGFDRVRDELPRLQRFLEENLPAPVNRSVTLLTLDREQIVLAASSPAVASYLRLHAAEIRQQLRETFGFEQTLRFRTVPDALLRPGARPEPPPPRQVSAQSVAALRRNAEWIDDEKLRAALLSLAQSLEAESD